MPRAGWVLVIIQPEVVSRYRDSELQVDENDSYLFNLRPTKSWCLNTYLIPNNSDLIKNEYS